METFRTRARTLDMLGRQQIAGIPTAISELFKNAHDAYADHVEIDYYRSDGLFVLRDDGIGMSRDDFVTRWLTIGTESKFDTAKNPPADPNKKRRPKHERIIKLDERDGALLVADTGPGVNVRDREAIFEFGFSRKPGGRGMGLHIGRESLHRVGFDLRLIEGDRGATFSVVPVDDS